MFLGANLAGHFANGEAFSGIFEVGIRGQLIGGSREKTGVAFVVSRRQRGCK